jgi:hypothetical protein
MDRVVAIDWSGAKARGGRGAIALAEVTIDGVVRLDSDLDRGEAIRAVLDLPVGDRSLVAFDFAFSLPKWYLEDRGFDDPARLWEDLASDGPTGAEELIARCEPPFWGRPGKTRPHEPSLGFRKADREHGAKPVFQLGGAGSVGTGTLRGMPHLPRLRDAGWAIWPFDEPGKRVVVEMYPRNLYRLAGIDSVRKSDPESRRAALGSVAGVQLSAVHRDLAVHSEHAFDALTAAVGLWGAIGGRRVEFPVPDSLELVEGMIFQPG